MLKPLFWDYLPAEFKHVKWKATKEDVKECPGIIHPDTQCSIFMLELSDNDKRQIFDGNPVYLCVRGKVPPFALSANMAEMIELARLDRDGNTRTD